MMGERGQSGRTGNYHPGEEGQPREGQEGFPSQVIDVRTLELGDRRDYIRARVRGLIKEAELGVVKEVKWRKPSNPLGVPGWSHAASSAPARPTRAL